MKQAFGFGSVAFKVPEILAVVVPCPFVVLWADALALPAILMASPGLESQSICKFLVID